MHSLEQQSAASAERQIAGQQAFLGKAEETYARLASSVGQSLTDSVAESARVAGSALQPVMETTMAGLARETAALHDALTQAVQRQLDGLSAGFETTAAHVADVWRHALADHQRSSDALAQRLHGSIDRIVESFDRRSADLLDGVRARLDATASSVSDAWRGALAQQEQANEAHAERNRQALETAAATFERHSAALLRAIGESHSALQATLESRDEQRLATWTDSLSSIAAKLGTEWAQTSAQAANRQQTICDALAHTSRDLSAQATAFEQHTAALLRAMSESHSALQATLESRDEQRLATWTDSLGSIAAKLGTEWEQTSAQAANRQQAIYDALAHTARDLSAHTQAHASATIAEISQLVQAASEAPRIAAEVVAELRQKLSDSMVRDTAMLEERNRMLATLETLLDAVNHASSEQRAAVDALVATSSALLQRVGTQFTDEVGTQTDRLGGVAAQITGSAVEIASLGDALGAAVQSFGESNDKLVAHLQRIEAALDKSLARSDEQLAYYVAQAREVIDLSMMSQKQIIEELQRVGGERASAGAAAA
ncbi:Methyl-accepting chemotaxis protein [Burkholderia pseudomallei]|nr:Methyl-accepting chemotaxis protein [Burkholderia pseudomallei]